jgi:23S rRNA (uracil1939-C5)-methyltransferase
VTVEIAFEKFNLKGYGVGRLPDGKEVEVPHAIVGDVALVDWKKKKRPPQKGRLFEIVTPAPARVAPRCPHTRICGGCAWQEMAYEEQLKEKQRRVEKVYRFPVDPILPASSPFGYRNKMEFSFSQNRGGERFLGLMIAAAEPYVFNVKECHLGASWNAPLLDAVRKWWVASGIPAYSPHTDTGSLRYLTLRSGMRTGEKMAILNISNQVDCMPSQEQLDALVVAVRQVVDPISLFLRIHETKKGTPTHFREVCLFGPDHITEKLELASGTLDLKISPASFFQPNTFQAEKLYDIALAGIAPGSVVYDLYCGTGTLTLAASRNARRVVGVEISADAIRDAETNRLRNQITNVEFHQGDVGVWLGRLPTPDVLILDPPRAGLDPAAIKHIQTLLPKQIVYISCNPLTQAANVEVLLQSGYRLTRLQPIDQFPHTYHIENIAFLER